MIKHNIYTYSCGERDDDTLFVQFYGKYKSNNIAPCVKCGANSINTTQIIISGSTHVIYRCEKCYGEMYNNAIQHFQQYCLALALPLLSELISLIVHLPVFAEYVII